MYGKHLWRVSQECHQSNLIDGAPFLANGILLRLGEAEMKKLRDYCKLSFPVPLAACLHILSSLASLILEGLLAGYKLTISLLLFPNIFCYLFNCFLMLALLKKGSKSKSKSKYRYVGKIVWDITPTLGRRLITILILFRHYICRRSKLSITKIDAELPTTFFLKFNSNGFLTYQATCSLRNDRQSDSIPHPPHLEGLTSSSNQRMCDCQLLSSPAGSTEPLVT